MPSTIICPKCRKPQEESGRLTCPECSSILPTNGPQVATATAPAPVRSSSNALDEFAIPARPTGAMTLLRNDLRSESKERQQSGWLDNLMPKKGKETPEIESTPKARAPRDNSGLVTPTEEAPVETKKPKAPPIAAASASVASVRDSVRAEIPFRDTSFEAQPATEARPTIPLSGVGYGVTFAVLATLGSLRGNEGWLGLLVFITAGLLGASILGTWHRQANKKAFWQGFAVFGIGYMLMAFVPAFPYQSGVELPTNRIIKVVHAKLTGTPEDTRSSFAIMKVAEPSTSDTPALFDPDAKPKPAPAPAPASAFGPGDVRQFTVVGHCGFTMVFAFIGSALSGWFYRSRPIA